MSSSENEVIDILIAKIIKDKTLNLKTLPEKILEQMYFDANGPSHVLSTVSIYLYMNYCEKNNKNFSKAQLPLKTLLKITRDVGFLCQVERMKRRQVLDYSIDMDKIFEPGIQITLSKGANFLNAGKGKLH